jgi:hypothetical protein
MFIKIILGLIVVVIGFLAYVATRDGKFRYERSGLIKASPEKIFPYISNLRLGGEWSYYEKADPNMKKSYSGEDGKVGSKMEFESQKGGSGSIEILNMTPNQSVDLRLIMTAPFKGDNLIHYSLTPEAQGTRFTWTMSGDGGFMSKLMTVFIDCEKMVGDQFSQGIQNLQTLMESQK